MDTLRRILSLFFLSSLLVSRCRASNVHTFNWGFPTSFVSQTLSECETHPIHLIPLNSSTTATGTPPYYMFAYAEQGTTIVTNLGSDPNSLSWQVQHPKGSSLLLTVVDGAGNTGGFTSNFLNVVAGSSTSCQPSAPQNPPVVHSNVTNAINTCDPWGLTITGGVKPYSISLAAKSAPVVTNVTLGAEDDVLVYVDRADPGSSILAAVVDATGQWGISSIAVNTAGAAVTDSSCLGLNTHSTTTEAIQTQEAAVRSAAAKRAKAKSTAIGLGIVFGLVLPIILAGLAFWYWRRRRQLVERERPRPYDPSMQETGMGRPSLNVDTSVVRVDGQPQRTQSWVVDGSQEAVRGDSPTSIDMTSTVICGSATPTPYLTSPYVQSAIVSMGRSPQSQLPLSAVSQSMSPARTPISPPFAMTPNSTSPAATLSPAQRYRKALEAHAEAQAARARLASGSDSGSPSSSGSSTGAVVVAGPSSRVPQRSQSATVVRQFPMQPVPRRAGSSLRLPPVTAIPDNNTDIVFQHSDGGIIEELPPPYPVDRYSAAPGPSTLSPTGSASPSQRAGPSSAV